MLMFDLRPDGAGAGSWSRFGGVLDLLEVNMWRLCSC